MSRINGLDDEEQVWASLKKQKDSAFQEKVWSTTTRIRTEVSDGRIAAHEKHGDDSIESVDPDDPRWVAIVGEEVGEWMAEWNYDRDHTKRRAEAIDVLACLTAWVAAYDEKQVELEKRRVLLGATNLSVDGEDG